MTNLISNLSSSENSRSQRGKGGYWLVSDSCSVDQSWRSLGIIRIDNSDNGWCKAVFGFSFTVQCTVFRVPGVELVDASARPSKIAGNEKVYRRGGWRARRATKVKAKRTKKSGSAANSTRLDSTRLDGGGGENVPEVEVAALGLGYPNWLLGLFARSLSLSLSLSPTGGPPREVPGYFTKFFLWGWKILIKLSQTR